VRFAVPLPASACVREGGHLVFQIDLSDAQACKVTPRLNMSASPCCDSAGLK
jgi:hypothetical protein